MTTVKLSYSILNSWSQNRYEDAVGMYLGKGIPETPALQLGKLKHELWAQEVMKNKALPIDFGGKKLKNPIVEQKYEQIIPFSDDIQILLRGVIDTSDDPIIYEYKCGMTPSGVYADSMQGPYYTLFRPEAKEIHYLCYNPYTKKHTNSVRFVEESTREKAIEHIISNASEMIDYLQVQRLLKNYEGSK